MLAAITRLHGHGLVRVLHGLLSPRDVGQRHAHALNDRARGIDDVRNNRHKNVCLPLFYTSGPPAHSLPAMIAPAESRVSQPPALQTAQRYFMPCIKILTPYTRIISTRIKK